MFFTDSATFYSLNLGKKFLMRCNNADLVDSNYILPIKVLFIKLPLTFYHILSVKFIFVILAQTSLFLLQ